MTESRDKEHVLPAKRSANLRPRQTSAESNRPPRQKGAKQRPPSHELFEGRTRLPSRRRRNGPLGGARAVQRLRSSPARLGWFRSWDPVENAAPLLWLTAAAYVDSTIMQERRGMFIVWLLGFGMSCLNRVSSIS